MTIAVESPPTLQRRNVITSLLIVGGIVGQYGGNRASFVALSFGTSLLGVTLALVGNAPRPVMMLAVIVLSVTGLRVIPTPGHSGLGEGIWVVGMVMLISVGVGTLVGAGWLETRSKLIRVALQTTGVLLLFFALGFDTTRVGRGGDTLFRAAIRQLTGSDSLGRGVAYFLNQYSLLGVALFAVSNRITTSHSPLSNRAFEPVNLPPENR